MFAIPHRSLPALPFVLVFSTGCSELAVTAVDVANVLVSPTEQTIFAGESTQLTATVEDGRGNRLSGRQVSWTSSDPEIATVTPSGGVTGVGAGVATVRASAEGRTGEATVTVLALPVATVTVTPGAPTVIEGRTVQLTATPRAEDGSVLADRTVTWSAAEPRIATVDASGLVTGVSVGETLVHATSEGQRGEVRVTVRPRPVSTVVLAPAALTLVVGDTARLAATPRDDSGAPLAGRPVVWSSADPGTVQVDGSGKVQAVAAGSTTVRATVEGVSAQARVDASPKPIATVAIQPNPASVLVGGRLQLQAVTRAADGSQLTGRTVTWTTSRPSVATVDATGTVAGIAPGSATITATAEGVVGQASITVRDPSVASVTVAPATATLKPGDTHTFTATARAADGSVVNGRPVSWSTSAAAVVTVDGTGKATAVANGNATITATVDGVTGNATVTVATPPAPVATVTVAPSTVSLAPGGTAALTAQARAADGTLLTGRPTTWSTSAAGVATVSSSGQVTAVADGTATITATVEGVTGSAAVTVASGPPPVASVRVQPTSATLNEGDLQQLQAQPLAADGTPLQGRTVTWSSGDNAVATVNGQGRVRAVSAGTVVITATSEGVNGTATITVQKAVGSVQIRPGFSIIRNGTTLQLQADVRATDGTPLTGRTVTWTTSDASVATINSNGLLTARSQGAVTVTAVCEGKTDTAVVWVLP